LKNVWFRGGFPLQSDIIHFGSPKKNEMREVSFENAELEDVTFSDNCDLSTVTIKSSNHYYKYNRWKSKLEFLKLESLNWDNFEKKEIDIFLKTYLVHAEHQDWYIINRNDLERDYGKDVSLKIIDSLNNHS
jgi:fluoroquinolone resistance protein